MEKNIFEKILWSIANATIETTSVLCFYEPKTPDKLLIKDNKKEK